MQQRCWIRAALGLVLTGAVAAGCRESAIAPATPPPQPSSLLLLIGYQDAGAITVVDSSTRSVTATFKIADRVGPIALDRDGTRAFAYIPGAIAIFDPATGAVVGKVPFEGEPAAIVPAGNRLYVIGNTLTEGQVWIVDLVTGSTGRPTTVDDLAGAGVLTADGTTLFVPHHFYSGRVTALSAARLKVRASLSFEDGASRLCLGPDDRLLYVPNGTTTGGRVTVVDARADRVLDEIVLEGEPADCALSADGSQLYVPLFRDEQLVAIDVAGRRVSRTIAVPAYPGGIARGADALYIIHNGLSALSVIDLDTYAVSTIQLPAEPSSLVAAGQTR